MGSGGDDSVGSGGDDSQWDQGEMTHSGIRGR